MLEQGGRFCPHLTCVWLHSTDIKGFRRIHVVLVLVLLNIFLVAMDNGGKGNTKGTSSTFLSWIFFFLVDALDSHLSCLDLDTSTSLWIERRALKTF